MSNEEDCLMDPASPAAARAASAARASRAKRAARAAHAVGAALAAGLLPLAEAHAQSTGSWQQIGPPGAQVVSLALAQLEQPQRFNAAVLAFLQPEDEAARYLATVTADNGFADAAARRLFEYDAAAPLDVREEKTETRGAAEVVDLSYASPLGGRVPAYLVRPRRGGAATAAVGKAAAPAPPTRHPAAVFVHLGQGNRGTFLDEAVDLGGRGLVSLLIGAPFTRPEHPKAKSPFDGEQDRRDFVQAAIDVRRGFDLLAARDDVDATHLGYVGHSFGATIGGPLLATEPRVQAWVLMAGFAAQTRELSTGDGLAGLAFRTLLAADDQQRYLATLAPIDSVRFLPHAPPAPILFQFARRDEYVAPWDAALWQQARRGPYDVVWYDTGHTFDADARLDRDAWLLRQLGLGAPPPATALFALDSDFWVNLHHFLHSIVRLGEQPAPAAGGPLTAAEQRAWDAAVATYRTSYRRRDLLFDPGMAPINATLAGLPTSGDVRDLAGAALPVDLAAALAAAAPVYRAHWWAHHDAANRAWIAAVTPRLARSGQAIAARIARAYRVEWPATPIRVDVTCDAGVFGAYTTDQPFTHVNIASTDPRNGGDSGLESLFHEASHGWGDELVDGVAKAAADRGRPAPDSLWHAILFYTAGEATHQALAAAGDPTYVPYAVRNGVYDHANMQEYPPALAAAWQPYLDGKTDFASALHALIDALPTGQR
jgi:dienelactone hydrolase